jgi:AcrR family transcriptional regulator
MKSTTSLRQRRTQETRQLILDAAFAVFGRLGYGEASVDRILAEAGLSKGAFYHHFPSKEELFRSLMQDRVRRCTGRLTEAMSGATSVHDAFQRLAAAGIRSFTTEPDWMPVSMEFWAQATRQRFAREVMAESVRHCRELVADMLRLGKSRGTVRNDLDAERIAIILIGMFEGIAFQWAIDPEAVDLESLVEPMAAAIERIVIGETITDIG